MKKQILHFIFFNVLKNSKNKFFSLIFILLLLIPSLTAAYPQGLNRIVQKNDDRAIVWDVTLHFNEPNGEYDYAVFGEAPESRDGPPVDTHDTMKPPAPIPSYIRAYFDDNLPFPYNNLLKDYRHFPDNSKTWNLTVLWIPSSGVSPTIVTINWSATEINTSEYNIITLCTNEGTPLEDMRLSNSYTFSCSAFIPHQFRIICIANEQPEAPSNPSPTNESTGIIIDADLSWSCSDPDGDPLTYDVYFGTSSSPPKIAENISSTLYAPGTMDPGTVYYWKIIAWDIYSFSTPGPKWHFRTNYPPNKPSNPNPANNSLNISINAVLSWTGGDVDPGDIVTYDVYFGTSTPPQIVMNNQTSLSYNPGPLDYETLYYWRIIAWDSHDVSCSGSLWHFTTGEQANQPPNPPSDPFPADGSTDICINVDLDWSCSDPDGDPLTYDVYFGTSSSPPKVASNITTSAYALPLLDYDTYYYWRIIAWDDEDAWTYGSLWSFLTTTLPNRPPYTPKNPYPADGETEIPVTVQLLWSGGDPDCGDIVTYDIYFGSSLSVVKIASNISETDFLLENLNYQTKYYWKIVAWDSYGYKNSSEIWSFTTKIDKTPPSLAIISPLRGYLYVNLWGIIVTKKPLIFFTILIGQIEVTATATDSESGVNRVEIYIQGNKKASLTSPPYTWTWTEWGFFFPYTIEVRAYDNVGNCNTESTRVWKWI